MASCSKRGLVVSLSLLFVVVSYTYGRSIRSLPGKAHRQLRKRSISPFVVADTCPPLNFVLLSTGNTCQDTCIIDNECPGYQLCCDYNGCKTCTDPVLPPPVIDWMAIPDNRAYMESHESNQVPAIQPEHYVEEVTCYYDGRTLKKDQVFYKGCHRCQCRKQGINCEVGPCRQGELRASSGDDEQSGDDENRVRTKVYARLEGQPREEQLVRLTEVSPYDEGQEDPTDQESDFHTTSGYSKSQKSEQEPTEQLTELQTTASDGGGENESEWGFESQGQRVKPTLRQRIFPTAPVQAGIEEDIRERGKVAHVHDIDTPPPPRTVMRRKGRRHHHPFRLEKHE